MASRERNAMLNTGAVSLRWSEISGFLRDKTTSRTLALGSPVRFAGVAQVVATAAAARVAALDRERRLLMSRRVWIKRILAGAASLAVLRSPLFAGSGTFTVRTSGGNYTTLAGFEAGEQANLTGTGPAIAVCQTMDDSTAATFDGWATTAADYIRVYADTGHRHPGYWSTSAYRRTADLTNWEDYARFEGLQWRVAAGAIPFQATDNGTTSADCRVLWCVFDGNGGQGSGYIIRQDHRHCLVASNVFNNNGGGAVGGCANISTNNSSSNSWVYNNTFRGANSNFDSAIRAASGTWYIRNNAALNTNDPCFLAGGTTSAADYNATDDASGDDFGGSNNKINQSFTSTFVDASNGDLHLQSGDTVLKDAGQDLSADPNSYGGSIGSALATDIDGATRSGSWDIGADEVSSAPAASPRRVIFIAELRERLRAVEAVLGIA
jgi:hypothetical protein